MHGGVSCRWWSMFLVLQPSKAVAAYRQTCLLPRYAIRSSITSCVPLSYRTRLRALPRWPTQIHPFDPQFHPQLLTLNLVSFSMSELTSIFKKPKTRDRKTKYRCDGCRKSLIRVSQRETAHAWSPTNRHVVFIHSH